jgi:hypothetical protein
MTAATIQTTVLALQGHPVSNTPPNAAGQLLTWNGTSWAPGGATSITGGLTVDNTTASGLITAGSGINATNRLIEANGVNILTGRAAKAGEYLSGTGYSTSNTNLTTVGCAPLGSVITPKTSGVVLIWYDTGIQVSGSNPQGVEMFHQPVYGTGTPPGAGTTTGLSSPWGGANGSMYPLTSPGYWQPCLGVGLMTGLTLGTQYWFDIGIWTGNANNPVSIGTVAQLGAMEL